MPPKRRIAAVLSATAQTVRGVAPVPCDIDVQVLLSRGVLVISVTRSGKCVNEGTVVACET